MQLSVVVGVQINDTGSHNKPRRIDHLGCFAVPQAANLSDRAVLDAKVGTVARYPSSIDYGTAFDQRIELCHKSLLMITELREKTF